MNPKLKGLAARYLTALRGHLSQGRQETLHPAETLGRRAARLGLETLDLARMHERALILLISEGAKVSGRESQIRHSGAFFAVALAPIEETHRTALEANVRLNDAVTRLSRRTADLAKSHQRLRREIGQRKLAEAALRKSARHYAELLAESRQLQEQLRRLSHQLLSAHEEERKRISRELHDEIAQTLAGINVRLGALKKEANANSKSLREKISRTQLMVEESVEIVHRFARELRPTVLDDLGLIPALDSLVKSIAKQTRLHIRLNVFAEVEELDNIKRTVLYRVAQEALTNVVRHAHASRVSVNIRKVSKAIHLQIQDNGKSFQVKKVLNRGRNQRLGLLGMRERIEMAGGKFSIDSAPGRGTCVCAEIPFK